MLDRGNEPKDEPKSKDDKQYEHFSQTAAELLIKSIKALTDESIKKVREQIVIDLAPLHIQQNQILNKQQEILDQLPAKLTQLETQLTKVQTSRQQIVYSLERIEKRMEQLIEAQMRLLETSAKENQLLTEEHYQNCIIQPMVRSIFPAFDFIQDFRDNHKEGEQHNDRSLDDLTEGIFIQLRQFLSVYEVQLIQCRPGAKFDPRQMRPVKTVSTHNKRLDNRVAKSLRAGFRWRQDNPLRFESVVLYKYQEPIPTKDKGKD